LDRPLFEVGDIFRAHGDTYLKAYPTSAQQRRVMLAFHEFGTAALGGHVDRCDRCGHTSISYNSCRDRHCTKCLAMARAQWLDARQAELLPVHYFHVVFTVPDGIAALALQNQKIIYDILFRTAGRTLIDIAADPRHLGAQIGYLAVLHTWGQTLLHHPHVHCVVPGGGLSPGGRRWVPTKKRFFLPVRVLSKRFRHLFLRALSKAFDNGELSFFGELADLEAPAAFRSWMNAQRNHEWVVYSKRPFGSPEQVLKYLAQYTHRVAISNQRITNVTGDDVIFSWKDYRHGYARRSMTLHPHEFMRRLLMHVVPRRFVRIRYGGFMANHHRVEKLARCRQLLHVPKAAPPQAAPAEPIDWRERYELLTGCPVDLCPACRQGRMICIELLLPLRQPPPRMDSS
jgi:hypothetical protein